MSTGTPQPIREAGQLDGLPAAHERTTEPEPSVVGWHRHRWTTWADGRVITTTPEGLRLAHQAQTRRCVKCHKVKVRRVKVKVRIP